MSVKRWWVAVFGCCSVLACAGGGDPSPLPVGTEEPRLDPEQPRSGSENPSPDPEAPRIGGEEPLPNAQDPLPAGSPIAGEGGASAGDP